ncbi:MAG TPA: HD domain-containing phosphohydrolase, partial [Polyangia bacterium]|nr:HD domain-containing phosphohydrolase [Polyangia bacterium]
GVTLLFQVTAAERAPGQARLAELVGALSLATDLAAGFALETALRTCLTAVELGRAAGVTGAGLADVYYTGLLRFVGCTAFAHEQARHGAGDDQAFSRALAMPDAGNPRQVVKTIIGRLGRGAGALARMQAVVRTLSDPAGPHKFAVAHCDLAVRLAGRLGMPPAVAAALATIYERWDGRGHPQALAGEQIPLPARLMHVAWRAEIHRSLEGPVAAVDVVRARAGGELDPALARLFLKEAGPLLAASSVPSVWDVFLAAEPAPLARLDVPGVGKVAEAFAQFVDIKSPFTLGHSVGVAGLAHAAAVTMRLPDPEAVRVAALLHDIGRVSVPNGIWDKPGPLNAAERERVRMHAYQGERILAQSPLLAPYAAMAGRHHERLDGSGYHRGLPASALPPEARLLAVADVFHALTEDRPHRPRFDPAAAATMIGEEARAGRLDRASVEAVLAAAGQAAARGRGDRPAQLSEREVEVLCLVARGLSNKEIGARLFISAKTVQHHVAHVYEKTGVATRAAAALFAVEHQLLK